MFKKFLCLILFLFIGKVSAEMVYRGAEYQKLSNDVSLIFLETNESDNVFAAVCLSVGRSDDMDKSGKSELVGNIFKQKLEKEMNKNPQGYSVEMTSFIGQEQTLFSFYGKQVDLPFHIKCLARYFYDLKISEKELAKEKEKISYKLNQSMLLDKNKLRKEALQSLYWHDGAGKPFSIEELNSITVDDLKNFHEQNYTNNRLILIISGNLKNKDEIVKVVEENFSNAKKSEIKRLKEPAHHDATINFEMDSLQVKFPCVEIYWRLPNYRDEKSVYDNDEPFRTISPISLEMFLIHLKTELEKSLVDELKIASNVAFDYSFWSYSEGNLRISVQLKEKEYSKETEFLILGEIKRLAGEIDKQKLVTAREELYKSVDVFNYQTNVIDTMNWMSAKISAGYDYKFLKDYRDSIKNLKLETAEEVETVKREIVKFFKREPEVISVLNPKGEGNAV
ncbi:MAG: insulinase family protein [Alphaproteobacteria bacterium]|nr:insulinase family protein [Alphaproteobacteria bacterium]